MTLEQYLEKTYSPTCRTGYGHAIRRFLLTMGEKSEQASYRDIMAYIGLLRGQNLHPKTLRNNLFAIKAYYRYLLETGKREDHPCRYLNLKDRINRAIAVTDLYSFKELETMLQSYGYKPLKNRSPMQKQIEARNRAILGLLVGQALTALEITQVNLENVHLEKGEIYIGGNVKNKARTLSLQSGQILSLYQYMNEIRPQFHPESQALFTNYRGERMNSQGIIDAINPPGEKKRISPLKIRQSVIAHLLKKGNDLRVVQVFAGHRSSSSTEAYRQTGLEGLKAEISKRHPLQ
jgi:site-specific recombinase XerD